MENNASDLSHNDLPPPLISPLETTLRFLNLGAIGFGGGVAVIALMEQACVQRRHCVAAEEFLHGVGLGQILGPFAVMPTGERQPLCRGELSRCP